MDPWLERDWGDVRHSIVQYSRDQIAGRLPSGLFAAVEETVVILGRGGDHDRFRPDAGVFEPGRANRASSPGAAGGLAVAEPVRIRLVEQRAVEGHVVIRRIGGNEALVTAIEVLSPTNKIDRRGRQAYIGKRQAYYEARANVVEIDLLRAGEPLIDVPWDEVAPQLIAPYAACVRRAPLPEADPNEVEYYPFPLRERLPAIGIPLRMGDEDVALDLQALIDEAYARGRYGMRVDNEKGPEPPLGAEDAAWAMERVKGRGGEATGQPKSLGR